MSYQRSVLLEALRADVDLVAEDPLHLPDLLAQVPVQIVGVSADGNRHQVLGSARGTGERDLVVSRNTLADTVYVFGRQRHL
jgi:hypothetical protein